MVLIKQLLFIGILLAGCCAAAARAVQLPVPAKEQSFETAVQNIFGLHVDDVGLIAIPSFKNFLLMAPWSRDRKGVKLPHFGSVLDMKRATVAGLQKHDRWHGLTRVGSEMLLINGWDMEAFRVAEDLTLLSRHTIVWDLIRPAADSRGDPTRAEILEFRQSFRKRLRKVDGERFVGLAHRSTSATWITYLVGTRIKGYPIAQMRCEVNNMSRCQITHGCFTETQKGFHSDSVSGLAFHPATRAVVLADKKNHQVHVFRFASCYHIPYQYSLELPSRIKPVRGVFLDREGKLWVSSSGRDDYANASVFMWKPDQWRQKSAPTERSN